MKKRFIVRLFIHQGNVYDQPDLREALGDDLEDTVREFGDLNLDEILIFMDALTDEEKEVQIALLKQIAAASEIPVTAVFHISRTEDVKKLLYANAKKVVLNISEPSNVDMLKEVSDRFGIGKIAVCADNYDDFPAVKELAEGYACELYCFDSMNVAGVEAMTSLKAVVSLKNVFLDKLMDTLASDSVCGVCGDVVDGSINEINSVKSLCIERNIDVSAFVPAIKWNELKLNSDGLVPVIAQDYKTNEVLMMAYMNEEAFNATLKTGRMNYYSRSRQSQWEKGETSGHFQYVKSMFADCDKDTLLVKISQIGAACHTGNRSCFFNEICSKEYYEKNPLKVFEDVYKVIEDRKTNPKEGSYTNYLFDKGIDKILKKVGEEATEIVIAAKNPDNAEIKYEISDFLYHAMVLMVLKGVTWEEICDELADR